MGTLIALLLVLSTLTACSAQAAVESVQPAQPLAETLTYQVEMERHEDEVYGEDGALLASCSYQLPVLQVCREDGEPVLQAESDAEAEALEKAETFNQELASWAELEDFTEVSGWAEADRQLTGGEAFVPYELALVCSVYRQEDFISVSAAYTSYTGGSHANTVLLGRNFDLDTGVFLAPEVLAEDGQAFSEAVRQEIVRQISASGQEDLFWEDYGDIAADWSSYAVSFDGTGMTVAFSPYELACYAAGSQSYHFSFQWMSDYLDDPALELLGYAGE